jgi:hypothetical protein
MKEELRQEIQKKIAAKFSEARDEVVELTEAERQRRDEIWRKNSTRLADKFFESALRKLGARSLLVKIFRAEGDCPQPLDGGGLPGRPVRTSHLRTFPTATVARWSMLFASSTPSTLD